MPDHVLNRGGGPGDLLDLLRSGGMRRGRSDRFDAGDTNLTSCLADRRDANDFQPRLCPATAVAVPISSSLVR